MLVKKPLGARSGAVDPSRRLQLLVHAAEGKRVLRTDRHDDGRISDAAGLAAGEEQGHDLGRCQPCFGCVADTAGD